MTLRAPRAPCRIAIVGGGPGGLFTARGLQRDTAMPLDVTLYEASHRLGGKILTGRFDHLPARYEAGAAEFYDYSVIDEDPLRQLVAELGLPTIEIGGSAAVIDGAVMGNVDAIRERLGTSAATALLAFDQKAKARMTPRQFYEAGSAGQERTLVGETADGGCFAGELSTIRDPAARRYLEILLHSDLATEPHFTSVGYGLQNYLMNDPAYMRLYCIADGNERLVEELTRRLEARVRLEEPVIGVGSGSDGRLTVRSRAADGERVTEYDIVILALPRSQLAAVRGETRPLAEALTRHCAAHDHPAHYLRITMLFEQPFWRSAIDDAFFMLDHFDGCCLYDESAREPHAEYGVLGWLLGGAAAAVRAGLSDEALIGQALDALPSFLRSGRRLFLEGRVHRWTSAVSALPGGRSPSSVDRRHQPDPAGHPRLFLVGDYLFDSTLNGVLDSADHVSGWVASLLAEGPSSGDANP